MAQLAIREYDAKRMFAAYSTSRYTGYLIENREDISGFEKSAKTFSHHWIIKPDQLFGKRGKLGLIGVNMDTANIRNWWTEHFQKDTVISNSPGKLTTFLIEPFVPHTEEYYIAIKTERDHDVMYFSTLGGIEVEEHWDQVQSLVIPVDRKRLSMGDPEFARSISEKFGITDPRISDFITCLYGFFVEYGFAYLEVNPFVFDLDGQIVCLDMVARVDDSESFRQRKHWDGLVFPHPFGPEKTSAEQYIEKLDSETGASLKFRILNPDGRIWLLTSGGGASVIIVDTLADLGYAHEIGNYGECSGNPDRENTRAYTATLLETMLTNGLRGKYLIIAGAIANFTHIDKTFSGIIDAFRDHIVEMKKQDIRILVRRGGINDAKGLAMMKEACADLGLPCEIADGNVYMTDILNNIIL